MAAADGGDQGARGAGALRRLFPAQRIRTASGAGASGARADGDRRRPRQFRKCRLRTRARLLSRYDPLGARARLDEHAGRSQEHTSELQSLMRISYAVFFLKKKKITNK